MGEWLKERIKVLPFLLDQFWWDFPENLFINKTTLQSTAFQWWCHTHLQMVTDLRRKKEKLDGLTLPIFIEGKKDEVKGLPSTSTERKAWSNWEFFKVGFISRPCKNDSNSSLGENREYEIEGMVARKKKKKRTVWMINAIRHPQTNPYTPSWGSKKKYLTCSFLWSRGLWWQTSF